MIATGQHTEPLGYAEYCRDMQYALYTDWYFCDGGVYSPSSTPTCLPRDNYTPFGGADCNQERIIYEYRVTCTDNDGDGVTDCDGDCDDNDGDIYPGAEEVCDGKDNDCNGNVDDLLDNDGDGYNICDNDCNDMEI